MESSITLWYAYLFLLHFKTAFIYLVRVVQSIKYLISASFKEFYSIPISATAFFMNAIILQKLKNNGKNAQKHDADYYYTRIHTIIIRIRNSHKCN